MKAFCLVALLVIAGHALAEDTIAPEPVASIQAEYAPNQITLTWAPSPSADVASYRVYQDPPACDFHPDCIPQLVATIHASEELTFTGPFGAVLGRTFFGSWRSYLVAAVDTAGNQGPPVRPSLVGVADTEPQALVFASPVPNPSHGDVAFSWTMPSPGTARLSIVDLAGRTVRLVAGGQRTAGPQRVTWDGRDARGQLVRPGAYFAKLDSPWGSRSRMLVRTN